MLATKETLRAISYLGPFLTFGWFLLSSLWSVFTLQNLDVVVRRRTRNLVCCFEATISILFVVEAGTIIFQLFHQPSVLASTPTNIYALSQFLVYLALPILLWGTEKHQWYPHYGAWIITLAVDAVTSGILGSLHTPDNSVEWAQLAIRGVRMLVTSLILTIFLAIQTSKLSVDEEQTPLLAQDENSATAKRYGATNAEETMAKQTDEVLDKAERELKEKLRKLEERLKENGNWFTYIKEFRVFVPLIWPYDKPMLKLNIIAVGFCILAGRALTALKPLGIGAVANYLIQNQTKEAFIALGIFAILSWLDSSAGITGLRSLLWLPVEINAYAKLDTASYDHVMSLSCEFHDSKQTGEVYQSVSQGQSVVTLLESILYNIVPQLVDLVVAGFYLYFLFDAYLVLIAIATVVLFLTAAIGNGTHQQSLIRKQTAGWRHKYQVMHDTVSNWRTVIYFNQSTYSSNIYDASVRLTYKAYRALSLFWCTKKALESIIMSVASLAAYAYAVYSIIYGDKTVGSFVALQLYWASFTGQLPQIPQLQRSLLRQLVNAEELLRLLKTQPTVQDGSDEFNLKAGLVEFNDVSFSYAGSKQIIHDLTFHARPGQTIAIVGETGAGKSTILKLLFRFYDITAGSILIDGQDIRDVTLKSLRHALGVVPQDPSLFNDTIMANVRYARLDATDDEVMDACRAAAVHDKILTFKDGYATKVGERGLKLSGGELQRVAIARAILKDSRIILLDEATSSVDTDTEVKIQEALATLASGRTTFVVAHRLSTIQKADRIIVIHDGTIVEQGTLKQLIKLKGRFFNLWTKQINVLEGGNNEITLSNGKSRSNSNTESNTSSQTKQDSRPISENGDKASEAVKSNNS